MFCRNCGAELEDGQAVCPSCNERVEKIRKPKKAKKAWSKGKKWAVWTPVVAVSLVLALLIGGTVYLWQPFVGPALKENNALCKDTFQDDYWAGKVRDEVVATMGEYTLTNGQLQVYYWMQVYDLVEYYTEQYGEYATYYLGIDLSKPLSEQIYNEQTGQTWEQYFLEDAFYAWHRYTAMYDEAKKNNYQLPGELKKLMSEMESNMKEVAKEQKFESVDAMLQKELGGTVTFADYYSYQETFYVGNLYFSEVSAKLVFTEAEMDEFYQENKEEFEKVGISKESGKLADIRTILVQPVETKDENGNTVYTDDAWKKCEEKAQGILDSWLASGKTEASFASLAEKKSEDDNTYANGGLMEYVSENALTLVDVRHILIMPEGGTKSEDGTSVTYSEAEWEACRKEAQELLDQYLAGEKTEEAFGALANKHSDDNDGKVTNGGLYADVAMGEMVKPFEEWIFDSNRQVGETGLVRTDFGYHIMYFVHRDGAVNDWTFAQDRLGGDYTMVKTDEGYRIVFYVGDEEGWKVYCKDGLMSKVTEELRQSYVDARPANIEYWKVMLSARTEQES